MGGYLTPAQRKANAAILTRAKARRWQAEGHVLATLRSVGGSRRNRHFGIDPTRAQRPSSRLHGATRHGQRAAAFEARRPAAQAAARARLEAGDLRGAVSAMGNLGEALSRAADSMAPLAHKRMSPPALRVVR